MQRFSSIVYSNSSRLIRSSQWSSIRSLSTDNSHLYKPSTETKPVQLPEDLKGGQPTDTVDSTPKITATLTGTGKVWSAQNPGSIHVAPLAAARTTPIPSTSDEPTLTSPAVHQTTVHTTQGQVNLPDPFKAQRFQPETTASQLAEAAAASAFEPFEPNTPLTSPSSTTDSIFAPKISSKDVYSATTSPTAHFESVAPNIPKETLSFATQAEGTVYGGQDTFASTKKHPKENPFETGKVQEIPIQKESDIRENILREALQYVDERGWTMEAIRGGIRATNQPSTVEGLFSNGYDLVEYFMKDCNDKMATYISEKLKSGEMSGSRLLIDALKYRLRLVVPYARTWDQALAQGALPQNAMRGWKTLFDLSNNAWNGIGDTSTDINWYTKRLTVAAIYKSAEIYMLQDQTPDKIDTIEFLERRLNDFQTIGSVRKSVSKSLSDTTQLATGLLSVVRNLTTRR